MADWEQCTVGEFEERGEIKLTTGPFGTQLKAVEYVEHGIPVINVRNIGFGNIRDDNLEYLSEATVQRLSRHLLQYGDIVFGRKGAVERHAFIKNYHGGWFQGSDCLRLRVKTEKIIPRFLSYSFLTSNHQQWMINQCSHGATMSSLNQDILKRIQFLLPPPPIQQKIASILSAYDDLIENNTRRIKILEEMAQTIYNEWFVKFRFPGHENVKMVDSELGMIPEGWRVTTLSEITTYINRGIAPKYDDNSNSLVINQRCIRDNKINLDIARKHGGKVPSEKYVRFGDVLINSTGVGTLGRVSQLYENVDNCTVDTHVSIVRPSDDVELNYFGIALQQLESYFDSLGEGATGQTELRRDRIGQTILLMAPIILQRQFGALISPKRQLINGLLNKNKVLRSTRDLLLPRLISGEIDVSELDINVGEITA